MCSHSIIVLYVFLYYPVLRFRSDLCTAYLDYSAALSQILHALAAPKKLVAATASRRLPTLPFARRTSRDNGGDTLEPTNVGHSIPPPSHPRTIQSVRPIRAVVS